MTAADPQLAQDAATEERILEAAHRVFVARGTAGARMQEIAREAGVNHALLHYYFRSKERLAETVFRRAAAEFFPPLLALLGADLPLEAKVERIVAHEIDGLTRRPYLPGYLISELSHHPERAELLFTLASGSTATEARERVLRVVDAQLEAEVRAGRMRPVRVEQFVLNLLALCVFPFAARPMVQAVLGLDADGFDGFVVARRDELPTFILAGLRP